MILVPGDIPVRESLVQKVDALTTSVCGFDHEVQTASFPGCGERSVNMLCGHQELLKVLFSEVVELVLRNDPSQLEKLEALRKQQETLSIELGGEDSRISNTINDPMGGVYFDMIAPALSQGRVFQAQRVQTFRSWQASVLSLLQSL